MRRSPRRNLPPGGEEEFTRGPPGASTKDSNTFTPSPAVFWAQTPASAPVLDLPSNKELF